MDQRLFSLTPQPKLYLWFLPHQLNSDSMLGSWGRTNILSVRLSPCKLGPATWVCLPALVLPARLTTAQLELRWLPCTQVPLPFPFLPTNPRCRYGSSPCTSGVLFNIFFSADWFLPAYSLEGDDRKRRLFQCGFSIFCCEGFTHLHPPRCVNSQIVGDNTTECYS